MKKNNYKLILYLGLALLASFVFVKPVLAANITVDFEYEPTLFSDVEIIPGDEVSRYAKVTNHSGATQIVGVQATNPYDCSGELYCLADILDIEISENGILLYSNSLSNFFLDGIVMLSSLNGNDDQTQYDFSVIFPDTIINEYQALTTGFDLILGFIDSGDSSEGLTISGSGSSSNSPGLVTNPIINIQKSGDDSVVAGGEGQYILTIMNLGTSAAYDITVTDTLPVGFEFMNPTGTINFNNNQYTQTWVIDNLEVNGTHYIQYNISVPETAQGQYENFVIANSSQGSGDDFFDQDVFPILVPSVLGYDYQIPTESTEEGTLVLGFKTQDVDLDILPDASGEILNLLGLSDENNTNINFLDIIYILLIFFYFATVLLFLLTRKRKLKDEK